MPELMLVVALKSGKEIQAPMNMVVPTVLVDFQNLVASFDFEAQKNKWLNIGVGYLRVSEIDAIGAVPMERAPQGPGPMPGPGPDGRFPCGHTQAEHDAGAQHEGAQQPPSAPAPEPQPEV